MQKKTVDAVITFEPEKTKILQQGAHTLFSSAEIPNEIIDVLVVRKDAIAKIGEQQILAFLKAYNRALSDILQNLPAHYEFLNQRTRIAAADIARVYTEIHIPTVGEQLEFVENKTQISALIDQINQVLLQQGILKSPCRCQTLINPRYIERLQ